MDVTSCLPPFRRDEFIAHGYLPFKKRTEFSNFAEVIRPDDRGRTARGEADTLCWLKAAVEADRPIGTPLTSLPVREMRLFINHGSSDA